MQRRLFLTLGVNIASIFAFLMPAVAQSEEREKFSVEGILELLDNNIDKELVNSVVFIVVLVLTGISLFTFLYSMRRRQKAKTKALIQQRRKAEEGGETKKASISAGVTRRAQFTPLRMVSEEENLDTDENDIEEREPVSIKKKEQVKKEDSAKKAVGAGLLSMLFKKKSPSTDSRASGRIKRREDTSEFDEESPVVNEHRRQPSRSGGALSGRMQQVLNASEENEVKAFSGNRSAQTDLGRSIRRNNDNEDRPGSSILRKDLRRDVRREEEDERLAPSSRGERHDLRRDIRREDKDERPASSLSGGRHDLRRDIRREEEDEQPAPSLRGERHDLRRAIRREEEDERPAPSSKGERHDLRRNTRNRDEDERGLQRDTRSVRDPKAKGSSTKDAKFEGGLLSRAINTVKEKAEESGISIGRARVEPEERFSGRRLSQRLNQVMTEVPSTIEPIKKKSNIIFEDRKEENIKSEDENLVDRDNSGFNNPEDAGSKEKTSSKEKASHTKDDESDVLTEEQDPFSNYKNKKSTSKPSDERHLVYEPAPPKRWDTGVHPEHFQDVSGGAKEQGREEVINAPKVREGQNPQVRLKHVIDFYATPQPKREAVHAQTDREQEVEGLDLEKTKRGA